MTDSIQQRVARGAQWLDTVRPGWRDAVNLKTLQLSSDCNCVIGQVYAHKADEFGSGYGYLCQDTGFEHRLALGFTSSHSDEGEFAALNAEWRRVIHQGREVPTHPAAQREAVQA